MTETFTNSKNLTASVASAAVLFDIDVEQFDRVAVQITSAGSGCTITYEASNDGTTWYTSAGYASSAPATETVTTSNALGLWVFRLDARRFRARVSTYGSGTVTADVCAREIHTVH